MVVRLTPLLIEDHVDSCVWTFHMRIHAMASMKAGEQCPSCLRQSQTTLFLERLVLWLKKPNNWRLARDLYRTVGLVRIPELSASSFRKNYQTTKKASMRIRESAMEKPAFGHYAMGVSRLSRDAVSLPAFFRLLKQLSGPMAFPDGSAATNVVRRLDTKFFFHRTSGLKESRMVR